MLKTWWYPSLLRLLVYANGTLFRLHFAVCGVTYCIMRYKDCAERLSVGQIVTSNQKRNTGVTRKRSTWGTLERSWTINSYSELVNLVEFVVIFLSSSWFSWIPHVDPSGEEPVSLVSTLVCMYVISVYICMLYVNSFNITVPYSHTQS